MNFASAGTPAKVLHLDDRRPAASGGRDLRLDLLRGAAMVAMVVDHVGGSSSWLYVLTGGNVFYVSAAEVFVFLSGFVSGKVYGGVAIRKGLGAARQAMLRRAGLLYCWSALLGLLVPLMAAQFGLDWGGAHDKATPVEAVIGVLTLHRTSHLVDVLTLYVLLFLAASAALPLVVERRAWLLLGGSWSLWLLAQISPAAAAIPWGISGGEVFPFASWQALFFTGLVAGHHQKALSEWLSRVPLAVYASCTGAVLGASVLLYEHELTVFQAILPAVDPNALARWLFSKADVAPGRLIVFAALAVFGFSVVSIGWRWISPAAAWLLLPLGQHSLSAYVMHVGVVAMVVKLGTLAFGIEQLSASENVLLQLTAVAVVWLLIQTLIAVQSARRSALSIKFVPARQVPAALPQAA